MDKFYTFAISALNRSFNGYRESLGCVKNGWYLTGSTLEYFIANYTLSGLQECHVAVNGNIPSFIDTMVRQECEVISEKEYVFRGIKIIIHPISDCPDTVSEYAKDYDRMKLQFPVNIGTDLDNYNPKWFESTIFNPFEYNEKTSFFTSTRRKNGVDFIGKMLDCGTKAGIRDKMFLGFGNCLGYALVRGFLPNDDDIDMCIIADDISQDQRHQYLMACKDAGLCRNRIHGPVSIDGKYCWFSIGPKSPFNEDGVKSCNWFWFKHSGLWWHSKGSEWIGRRELSPNNITAKGIPESYFKGTLKTVRFQGEIDVQIPDPLGVALDWWYPGWVVRKKDASAINVLLNIPNDKDKKTWFITKK
jgi:hypothetical protein